MELKALAASLGITEYPEGLEAVYRHTATAKSKLADPEELARLEAEYQIFGELFPTVQKGAEELRGNEALFRYTAAVAAYVEPLPWHIARTVPLPKPFDGIKGSSWTTIMILLSLVPKSAAFFTDRGLDKAEIKLIFGDLCASLKNEYAKTGSYFFDISQFGWSLLILSGEMTRHGVFFFHRASFNSNAVILKNKQSGERLPMMTKGSFHRSGEILGSAGCTDKDGAFEAEYYEDESIFQGHLVRDGVASPTLSTLKKEEWECVLRTEDNVLSLHIPTNSSLSPEDIQASFREGVARIKKCFPEFSPKAFYCHSWLLSTSLESMIGEKSKIVQFGNRFLRFPVLSNGLGHMSYVFPSYKSTGWQDLPEGSSLQRNLKAHYLSGKFILESAGVIMDDPTLYQ
ncbi:MAG: hypothetical protein IJX13_08035 [Clostridia bacterium]|nr:hypothetical protein [Clostridia bacterium]